MDTTTDAVQLGSEAAGGQVLPNEVDTTLLFSTPSPVSTTFTLTEYVIRTVAPIGRLPLQPSAELA